MMPPIPRGSEKDLARIKYSKQPSKKQGTHQGQIWKNVPSGVASSC